MEGSMKRPINILLQTTIPTVEDDWHIGRFSLLHNYLRSVTDEVGVPLFAVATRDHMDLGSSICSLGGVGAAHYFHSHHPDPDESNRTRDDQDTKSISWPNYHSGNNGDYQKVTAVEPIHELLVNPNSAAKLIEYFPAHPHEGGVGVPENEPRARVIATGTSKVTGRPFNLAVAFEHPLDSHGNAPGRAVAESSFHHFVDYNWNTDMGCPSFVEESPGEGIKRDPEKLSDMKTYVRNLAFWLAP